MALNNIDLDLLKFMSNRNTYYKYKKVIHKGLCTKESWNLLEDFGKYYQSDHTIQHIHTDFPIWLRVSGRPGWKQDQLDIYATIVKNILAYPMPVTNTVLTQLENLKFQSLLDEKAKELRLGKLKPDKVVDELMAELHSTAFSTKDDSLQVFDLEDLALHSRAGSGLYWRLEDLNISVGPIDKGDLVIIGKRPEVGGTSFLVSEMTHMLEQTPPGSKVVLFNNEEAPDKLITRVMGAALGIDYRTMMNAPSHWKAEYTKWLDGREFHLHHSTSMDLPFIHRVLNETRYSVIGINIILKVSGTQAKEDHDKYQALGVEFRNLAQRHGPIIGIAQADPSAESMRYIPQDRLYKSKTALQGEADVLIMIGSDDDNAGPDTRFIHVAKNKIPPAPCVDLVHKHIKSEVKFDIETGRFHSKNFSGNSRSKK